MDRLKQIFVGNRILQRMYASIHRKALYGMNYGQAGGINQSGEEWVLKKIKTLTGPENIVVFDVGANHGDYSLLVSKYFSDSNNSLFAFEPLNRNFKKLENNLKNVRINLFQFGMSERPGKQDIYFDEDRLGWTSLHNYSGSRKLNESEKISLETIDEFCKNNSLNKITLLKIDVEGHELPVLKGAKRMITEQRIDFIQFEFGIAAVNTGFHLKDFFEFLKDFEVYRIVKAGLVKLKWDESLEIYLTTNYLAVRKGISI